MELTLARHPSMEWISDPSIFDERLANVTTVSSTGEITLSPWKAGMHHFVAYVMGSAGRNWGDQNLPPIQ